VYRTGSDHTNSIINYILIIYNITEWFIPIIVLLYYFTQNIGLTFATINRENNVLTVRNDGIPA